MSKKRTSILFLLDRSTDYLEYDRQIAASTLNKCVITRVFHKDFQAMAQVNYCFVQMKHVILDMLSSSFGDYSGEFGPLFSSFMTRLNFRIFPNAIRINYERL